MNCFCAMCLQSFPFPQRGSSSLSGHGEGPRHGNGPCRVPSPALLSCSQSFSPLPPLSCNRAAPEQSHELSQGLCTGLVCFPSHPRSVLSNFLQAFVQIPFDPLRPTTTFKISVSPLVQSSLLSFALVRSIVTNFFVPVTLTEAIKTRLFGVVSNMW